MPRQKKNKPNSWSAGSFCRNLFHGSDFRFQSVVFKAESKAHRQPDIDVYPSFPLCRSEDDQKQLTAALLPPSSSTASPLVFIHQSGSPKFFSCIVFALKAALEASDSSVAAGVY